MKKLFATLIFALSASMLLASVTDDLAPQRGRAIPSIHWVDETGRARQLSEFSGYPLILLPIYTRCPGPCLRNVDRLKEALVDAANNPRQFRVLLFSVDPSDNAVALAKYRQRENIPLGWSIGGASQAQIDTLLEAIGVQVGKAGKEFAHPNIVLFVDSKLRISKWIYGSAYSAGDVALALKVAGGESDWLGQHSQLIYSILLLAGSTLCVALAHHLMQLRSLRRSSRDHSAVGPLAADR